MANLEINIWSDIACPWCWVGKRGLDTAIESFGPAVTVRFRAFELNPSAPLGTGDPVDYAGRLADKYGIERIAAQEMIDRMVATAKERGLDLRFDRIQPTNTFDAHRLLAWARGSGLQPQLKEALFKAYLHDGQLISDHEVLSGLATSVGLDGEQARKLLQSGAFSDEVRQDENIARQIGINGVPCFVFMNSRTAVSGAQPAEVLLQAMRKAASQEAERRPGT